MQISLPIVPSKIPSIFPFHHPIYPPHPPHKSLSFQTQASPFKSLKTSGYLSTISRAIDEEEEYRKARAAVTRKGIEVEGYFIEGLSIGGHETCVIVPELKSAFDIGRCPARAIHQNFVFITHAHLDHIVSSIIWPKKMVFLWSNLLEIPLLVLELFGNHVYFQFIWFSSNFKLWVLL